MNAWDWIALVGATVSCLSTLARRHMLSGELTRWHSAPGLVQAALSFQSLVTGMVAISLMFRLHHATEVETTLLVVSGVVSATLWLNLARQPAQSAPIRKEHAHG